MRLLFLLFLFLFLLPLNSYSTILPPNDLYLEDMLYFNSNVSEEDFNDVIDRAEELYEPIFAEHDATLKINRFWESATVNASATQYDDLWVVNMYGGLARRPEVTKDGFALVVCHEIGHHIAGLPKYNWRWASNEGQSDYFATLSCARELWGEDYKGNREAAKNLHPWVRATCNKYYAGKGKNKRHLCYRMVKAGKSLADLLGGLRNVEIEYNKIDRKEVSSTYHRHPEAQCRFNTYVAGALCEADWDVLLIPSTKEEVLATSCTREMEDKIGLRPLCWYKP